jgi:asparagine synthetase B (glutamine-hydrolysing)
MCGITGILSPSGRHVIVPMTEASVHRGPDACGYYRDERTCETQTLSIWPLKGSATPLTCGPVPRDAELRSSGSVSLICATREPWR